MQQHILTCTKKNMSRENKAFAMLCNGSWGNNCYSINLNYIEKTNTAWEKHRISTCEVLGTIWNSTSIFSKRLGLFCFSLGKRFQLVTISQNILLEQNGLKAYSKWGYIRLMASHRRGSSGLLFRASALQCFNKWSGCRNQTYIK